jgi:PAS domain S-box-containing protein
MRDDRQGAAFDSFANELVAESPDALIAFSPEGRVLSWSRGAEAMFGYAEAEAVGRSLDDLVVPADGRDEAREEMAGLLGRGSARFQTVRRRMDGSLLDVDVSMHVVACDGAVRFVASCHRDVTHLGTLRAAIRDTSERAQMETRLQQASRLKSEFLSNMSHELRTPLNAIIGFSELLCDGKVETSSAQQREFLGYILTSGRHLLQLVNDILDLSKVEAGKMEFRPEPVDVPRVIEEIVSLLRTIASRKRLRLETSVDAVVERVVLDPGRLKQVLYNYLSNALKFTPEGGRIAVRVRSETSETFRLEVEDTGPGIEARDVGRLFIEFQQLDATLGKKHPGTGLGLALTRRIVEAQGGSVGVDSVPGEGSRFHAILPRRAQAGAGRAPARSAVFSAKPGAPAVLVIDDDAADQAVLVRALDDAGFAVETAASGSEGLARFRERHYDALMLDLLLPDMNGLELLQEIRGGDRTPDVPIIVVSVVSDAAAIGAFPVQDVLVKPVDEAAVLTSLERAGVRLERPGPVLVVDDDLELLGLMKMTLGNMGYSATCEQDCSAALLAAEKVRPRAVILDLLMPGMNGFEFLERFRQQEAYRDVPVIVWTAKDLTVGERAHLEERAQVVHKLKGGFGELIREIQRLVPRSRTASHATRQEV